MTDSTTHEELEKRVKLLHPFITPKDVSFYDPITPSNPHPKIAAIASLMNELYTLLTDMRYLAPDSVFYAPHTNSPIPLKTASLFGLEKQVVDLLQLLPYYDHSHQNWNYGSDGGEFLFWGEFEDDLRGEGKEEAWWRKCVDPLFSLEVDWKGQEAIGWHLRCIDVGEEGGEMDAVEEVEKVKGWLFIDEPEEDDSADGNWDDEMEETDDLLSTHSNEEMDDTDDLIFTDSDQDLDDAELVELAQESAEAALEQEMADSLAAESAALEAQAEAKRRAAEQAIDDDPRNEGQLLYIRPWHVTLNKQGNHGTVLFLNTHNFTLSETSDGNICDFEHNAIPYLRDVIEKFRSLTWIPGGLYSEAHGERYTAYKQCYLDSGWPESFDAEKFDTMREEYEAQTDQRYNDEEPLRKLHEHISAMLRQQMMKFYYTDTVEKLTSLSPSTSAEEIAELEKKRDQYAKQVLPEHFSAMPETYNQHVQELFEQGRTEEEVKYMRVLIAETEAVMNATTFEERDWAIYDFRREQALGVDEAVKAKFDWGKIGWKDVKVDLDTVLTPEALNDLARQKMGN
ncbi:hypothetical protein E4T47_03195 [Aureobasidium subglaciale]|nr:hypothetical protein E4T47_03195 [Aureobasidium subglaciale]